MRYRCARVNDGTFFLTVGTFKRMKILTRESNVDFKFRDRLAAQFISSLLKRGKRSTAEHIFYDALDLLEKKTGQPENQEPGVERVSELGRQMIGRMEAAAIERALREEDAHVGIGPENRDQQVGETMGAALR